MESEKDNKNGAPYPILTAAHMDLVAFASSKNVRYSLAALCYRPEKKLLEASDGRTLARLPVYSCNDYPVLDGFPPAPTERTLLPVAAVRNAAANAEKHSAKNFPNAVILGRDEKTVSLRCTDLETACTTKGMIPAGTWPLTDDALSRGEPKAEFILSAALLGKICDYVAKHGVAPNYAIRFQIFEAGTAVGFKALLEDELDVQGIIMTIREE